MSADTFRAMCAELAEKLVSEYGYWTEWEKGLPLCKSNVSELLTRYRQLAQAGQEVEATPDDDAWFHELVSEVARVQHVAAGEGQGPRFDLAEAVARCCHPATLPPLSHPEATND